MDTDFPHLSKAPIREALVDIRVEPRPELSADALAAFTDRVRAEFPEAHPIRTIHTELDVGGDEPDVRSSPPRTLGTICWNASKTRAVQARLDGFTVSHVQGYESWPELRAQAERLFGEYIAVAAPKRVVRCALRYINRVDVSVLSNMATSLLTRPQLGPDLPPLVDEFFMRVVIPFPEGRKASLTQASELAAEDDAETRGVILDIDAFSTRIFDIGDDGIWKELDELRVIKNTCFFSSLSRDTWETFL